MYECPECGSYDTDSLDFDPGDDEILEKCACLECNAIWIRKYTCTAEKVISPSSS